MVNEKGAAVHMKGRILSFLRATPEIISGETLRAHLGISRVAIWKHIRKLQERGYQIEATSKGYRLHASPDALFPWEFDQREALIHYFDEVSSTMDLARDMARQGCPHLTTVIAGRQIKGRGRLQRTWQSSAGGLYFTVVLRPQIPPALTPRINLAASLYLARTLNRQHGLEARVKWPNDILVDGYKISGMLSELEAETDRILFINIAMGINVNNDTSVVELGASSLKKIAGREISKKILLDRFLAEFKPRLKQAKFENVKAMVDCTKQYGAAG